MLNAKKAAIFIISLFLFHSCASNRVPDNTGTAAEVREALSELQDQQSDAAGTAAKVTEQSGNIAEESRELAEDLAGAGTAAKERADTDSEFKRIIDEIRSQEL